MRRPQTTEFRESVKIGDYENLGAQKCERHIVAEAGQIYAIEVTIKKGFDWGTFNELVVRLVFPGKVGVAGLVDTKQRLNQYLHRGDFKLTLDCVNYECMGSSIGAPFMFRSLGIGEILYLQCQCRKRKLIGSKTKTSRTNSVCKGLPRSLRPVSKSIYRSAKSLVLDRLS